MKTILHYIINKNILYGIIIIIFSSYFLTKSINTYVDVSLYDETFYLYNGVQIDSEGLPNVDFSPLYSLWYRFLYNFEKDELDLFYLNIQTLHCLIGILVFVLLMRLSCSFYASITFAILSFLLNFNIFVFPKSFHLVIVIIFSILLLCYRISDKYIKLIIIIFGMLLISYIRPEYFLLYILFVIFTAVVLIARNKDIKKHKNRWFVVLFLTFTCVVIYIMGIPLLTAKSNRSLLAFGQHFAVNWVSWNNSDLNPWADWEAIFTETFGKYSKLFIFNNPDAFGRHVLSNIKAYPNIMRGTISLDHSLNYGLYFSNMLYYVMVSISITVSYIYLSKQRINNYTDKNLWIFIASGLFCILPIIEIVMIYPRYHYCVIPVIIWLVLLGYIIDFILTKRMKLIVCIFAVILNLVVIFKLSSPHPNESRTEVSNTIRYIRELHIEKPVNILEPGGGIWVYLGKNYRGVPRKIKDTGFRDFIGYQGITMVMATPELYDDRRFKTDPEWNEFIQVPEKWDFQKLEIPDTGNDLFLKTSLIQ